MSRRPVRAFAAALALAACDRGAPSPATTVAVSTPAAADPWLAQAIAALGGDAPFVVVVDPSRWGRVHMQLRALEPVWSPELLAAADNPGGWFDLGLASVGLPTTRTPLVGWDRARPLVLALAEAPGAGDPGGFTAALPLLADGFPGLRHQAIVPAHDVAALTGSLGTALATIGTSRPELVVGHAGASAWAIGEDAWIAVLPGTGQVRVVAVTHAVGLRGPLAAPALVPASAGTPSADDAATLSVTHGDLAASVLVRPRRLSGWLLARTAHAAAQRLRAAGPHAEAEQLAAVQALLACEARMIGPGVEVETWAFGLDVADAHLHARVVASPSAAGATILAAGERDDPPLGRPRGDLLVDGWHRLVPDAMTAAAAELPATPTATDTGEDPCSDAAIYAALAVPFAERKRMERAARRELGAAAGPEPPLPAVTQLAVRDGWGGQLRAAVALALPPDADLSLLDPTWTQLAAIFGAPPQVTSRTEGHHLWALAGFDVDARALFEATDPAATGLAALTIDLAAAAPRIAGLAPELAGILRPYGRLALTLRRSGPALVGELDLGPAPRGAPEPAAAAIDLSGGAGPQGQVAADMSRGTGPQGQVIAPGSPAPGDMSRATGAQGQVASPGSPVPGDMSRTTGPQGHVPGDMSRTTGPQGHVPGDVSRGTGPQGQASEAERDCAARAAVELARELAEYRGRDPSHETTAAQRASAALVRVESRLACAGGLAPGLRRLAALSLAEALVAQWQSAEAATLLDAPCEQTGDAALCERRTALRAAIAPALPEMLVFCDEDPRPYAHRIAVTPAGISLDGRPVADGQALGAALLDAPAELGAAEGVELAIDRDMSLGAARPVLAALGASKPGRVAIVTRRYTFDTNLYRLPIAPPELEATAAPTPTPMPAPTRSLADRMGALVIAVDGLDFRIRTGMFTLGHETRASAGGLQIATRGRPDNGEPTIVHATDSTPWQQVAIALTAGCKGSRLVEPHQEVALLGPDWGDADAINVFYGPKPLSVRPPHRGPNNVNSGLLPVRPKLVFCRAQAMSERPQRDGKVVLAFGVDAGGRITSVEVESSQLKDPQVESCMVEALRTGAQFSGADGPVIVRQAFAFKTKTR